MIVNYSKGHRVALHAHVCFALASMAALMVSTLCHADTALIPLAFDLAQPGAVTVVIEDDDGRRIRNLDAERDCEAGRTVLEWDGRGDNGALVAPGMYRWRGLVTDKPRLSYEFSVYDAGASLPWFHPSPNTATNSGWLSDHNPAVSVCAVGDKVFVGAITSENGQSLMALDRDGHKVWGLAHLPGGIGAAVLGTDGTNLFAAGEGQWAGPNAHVIRIDPETYRTETIWSHKGRLGLRGLAVRDGLIYVSSELTERIFVIDATSHKVIREIPLPHAGGIAFRPDGALLAISGRQVVIFNSGVSEAARATVPTSALSTSPLITSHLTRPNRLTVAVDGTIYVSDGPTGWYRADDEEHNALYGPEAVRFTGDNQIKVFDAQGRFLRAIGAPGGRKPGPYNPQAMRCPVGLAFDASNRLWVTEWDMLPKRISVWDPASGKLVREFLGSHKYGGGGALDPGDRTQMILDGMLFKLDWQTGGWRLTDTIVDIMNVAAETTHVLGGYSDWPDRIVRVNGVPYYIANASVWNKGGTIWRRDGETFKAVACVRPYNPGLLSDGGPNTNDWLYARMVEVMGPRPPGGNATDIGGTIGKWNGFISYLMLWSDANGDGVTQPSEVTFTDKPHYWLKAAAIGPDLSVYLRMPAHRGVTSVWRLPPSGFNPHGAPLYEAARMEPVLVNAVDTANGSDVAVDESNNVFILGQPLYGVNTASGRTWSYPNPWPALGVGAPRPRPGVIVGGWGLRGAAGGFMALNSNYGQWYLFTADGFFHSTIFGDTRTAPFWGAFDTARRGMDVSHVSHGQESFFGWFGETSDEHFYCVAGHPHFSVIEVNGLDRDERLEGTVAVTAQALDALPPLAMAPPHVPVYNRPRTLGALGATAIHIAAPPQPGFYPDFSYACWLSYDDNRLYLEAKLPADSADGTLFCDLDLPTGSVRLTVRRAGMTLRRGDVEQPLAAAETGVAWRDDMQGGGNILSGSVAWRDVAGDAPAPAPGMTLRGDIGIERPGRYRLFWADKNARLGATTLRPDCWGTFEVQ